MDAPTLSIACPALARGLRDRTSPELRRKACVVIANIARVVSDPRDIAPFVPRLVPELERLASEVGGWSVGRWLGGR